MLKGVVMEVVEVFNQTSQLISFSHEDQWSGSTVFRDPIAERTLGACSFGDAVGAGWNKAAKLILAGVDIAFDSGAF